MLWQRFFKVSDSATKRETERTKKREIGVAGKGEREGRSRGQHVSKHLRPRIHGLVDKVDHLLKKPICLCNMVVKPEK